MTRLLRAIPAAFGCLGMISCAAFGVDSSSVDTPAPVDASAETGSVDGGAVEGSAGERDPARFPDAATVWSGNGHAYEVVALESSWEEARMAAEKRGGHLATMGSDEENSFVWGLVPPAAKSGKAGPWLGGVQSTLPDGGRLAKDEGWHWIVASEPWSIAPWAPGEPNDGFGAVDEPYLCYYSGPKWSDNGAHERRPGYVVEYEP